MRLIIMTTLLLITGGFANAETDRPLLAQYSVRCEAQSQTSDGTLNADFDGAISVYTQGQTGTLKLGSIGVFDFTADFKFKVGQFNNGVVAFSFADKKGFILTKSFVELPHVNSVRKAIYFKDPATNTTAHVRCMLIPVTLNGNPRP